MQKLNSLPAHEPHAQCLSQLTGSPDLTAHHRRANAWRYATRTELFEHIRTGSAKTVSAHCKLNTKHPPDFTCTDTLYISRPNPGDSLGPIFRYSINTASESRRFTYTDTLYIPHSNPGDSLAPILCICRVQIREIHSYRYFINIAFFSCKRYRARIQSALASTHCKYHVSIL